VTAARAGNFRENEFATSERAALAVFPLFYQPSWANKRFSHGRPMSAIVSVKSGGRISRRPYARKTLGLRIWTIVIMLDGERHPRFIWRTTEVTIKPLLQVDEAFAWGEGEGTAYERLICIAFVPKNRFRASIGRSAGTEHRPAPRWPDHQITGYSVGPHESSSG
jgi:hypothetical protein